tara:strand:- start:1139 stop:1882 length:744 start_codon:yes stop_codon:yes gene_type:complete
MKIIIDNREPDILINTLNDLVKDNNIDYQTQSLEIGDIQIFQDNEIEPSIIFERKSLSDLLASIKDGRYNEQSFRLDNYSLHNHNIYYLIEGNIENLRNQQDKQIIYSSLLTLSYFKGFSIINSVNIIQTANIIFRFCDKLKRETKRNSYYKDIPLNKENNNYSSVIKTSKKANITKDNILEIMLMQIPGISSNTASIIGEEYKTMLNLLKCLGDNPHCLDNLQCGIQNKRKISKTIIQNINEYLLQ